MKAKELKDLTISALLLALAFGIVFSNGINVISDPGKLVIAFPLALLAVSSGFVLHELGHRFVARRFGCFAEYTMWPAGLVLAIVFSLFGFVFAAPGAVMIRPGSDLWGRTTLTRTNLGLISIAGPVMNICLAVLFILLHSIYPAILFSIGAQVNTWLAMFNMIPLGPLDGAKIFQWDRTIWTVTLVVAVGLFVIELFYL